MTIKWTLLSVTGENKLSLHVFCIWCPLILLLTLCRNECHRFDTAFFWVTFVIYSSMELAIRFCYAWLDVSMYFYTRSKLFFSSPEPKAHR